MNKNIPFSQDIEFLELLRGALLKVYGRDISIKQIQEAHEVAELTVSLFKDSLEKIYSEKYGGVAVASAPQQSDNCRNLKEKYDALWLVHNTYVQGVGERCDDVVALGSGFFEPQCHKDNPELQKALKILFPQK